MNVAIIGCGLVGQKRLGALAGKHRLVVAADVVLARAEALAAQAVAAGTPAAAATANWREAVSDDRVDAVVIATTNDCLASVALSAVQAGKHVLVEKPGARTARELEPVRAAVRERGVCAWVGFNHRYHPAMQKAHEMFASGVLGPLLFLRARYGHGGRLGYEKEWRADPARAGGGELIDQGAHLIDLARWFLGDFSDVRGFAPTYFWDMPVEDNAFLLLRNARNQAAWLHASSTEWKNLFSFEIYGQRGKLHVEGLGGSYGLERLSYYRMLSQMGPPETTIWEYPGPDASWERELDDFAACIEKTKAACAAAGAPPQPGPSCTDALEGAQAVLRVVETVYRGAAPCRLEAAPHWGIEQMPRARFATPFPVPASAPDAIQAPLPAPTGGSPMKSVSELRVKLFADGADRAGMLEMHANPLIQGFTTNPTLMRKAGVSDYRAFALEILAVIRDRPISFEVFADDPEEMELQALEISSWAENVFVKIPVTNTRGQSTARLLRTLARLQVKVNVTALTTLDQVQEVSECLSGGPASVISVFAGRIADTGRDPVPLMAAAVELLRPSPNLQLLWASPRELLNIFQADAVGCHIITATNDILKKLSLVQKDLREYSLETVRMFYQDAQAAGYRLETSVAGVRQA